MCGEESREDLIEEDEDGKPLTGSRQWRWGNGASRSQSPVGAIPGVGEVSSPRPFPVAAGPNGTPLDSLKPVRPCHRQRPSLPPRPSTSPPCLDPVAAAAASPPLLVPQYTNICRKQDQLSQRSVALQKSVFWAISSVRLCMAAGDYSAACCSPPLPSSIPKARTTNSVMHAGRTLWPRLGDGCIEGAVFAEAATVCPAIHLVVLMLGPDCR